MNTALTWMSLIGNLSFTGLLVAGLLHARHRRDLLKQERALKLYLCALFAILVSLVANVMRENWGGAISATVNLALIGISIYFTGKTCDRLEGVGR